MSEDNKSSKRRGFRFSIDRGGTFTDVYAELPNGERTVMKLLSVDSGYEDAPTEAIRRILEKHTGKPHPKGEPIDTSNIESIRMATTVATNALLERKGEPIALVITKGLRDLLHIGNQSRPKIFDLKIEVPEVLYSQVVEVSGRVILCEDGEIESVTGEHLKEERPLDLDEVRRDLQTVYDAGIRSLAVVLMHSYLHSTHEQQVGKIAQEIGFEHVSLSSEVMQMSRIVPRGYTACADAYLTPCIKRYIASFSSGFKNNLEGVSVLFMQSDGGLTPMESFVGSRAIVSGPAGGVVGYALTAYDTDKKQPVIGFDMGGTSTDVSRYGGVYEHVFETVLAGIMIQAPQMDIQTVASGGGSRCFFRSGRFVVGPESVGSEPGPVCYRKGGHLAITDANLVTGRLIPDDFPKIFGPNYDQPLDVDASHKAFEELTEEVNAYLKEAQGSSFKPLSKYDVALGFIRVANEAMCRPIRSLTQSKGHNIANHVLACFGGAGGQHACAIARSLGMTRIHVSKYSGILSAYGLAAADVVKEEQQPSAAIFKPENNASLWKTLGELTAKAVDALKEQGFADDKIVVEPFLNMRYHKTDFAMMICPSELVRVSPRVVEGEEEQIGLFREAFEQRYKREFSYIIRDRDIIVDDVRVRATGVTVYPNIGAAHERDGPLKPHRHNPVVFDDAKPVDTPVYNLTDLCLSDEVHGPAVICADTSTILVEPDCTAKLLPTADLEIIIGEGKPKDITTELDVVHLSVFQHRFMTIAEQMGRALENTAISTNIKERLDFSCAIFSSDGRLVANAPHIPVHLGAMSEAVKYQIKSVSNLSPGDVLVSNHPAAGGSHLPDITVITPVFRDGHDEPLFWVASRGHHADIGGITPGSMPPTSNLLVQEGAAIKSFKLVEHGEFQEQGITDLLMEPAKYPGSSGTRNLMENLADLRAQVAANARGIVLMNELLDEHGVEVVMAYMNHIQENAELSVRNLLKEVAEETQELFGTNELHCTDFLDDGTPICLKVTVDGEKGAAHFDFAGTGCQVFGNLNTPRAVVYSGIIYCLRCMVGHDIPLNQGCLAPVTVNIPFGSVLWPDDEAAVVGGNVLTSQRICDVVLKAFRACADSQGCMNNLTFGNDKLGYYETIGGGSGAGKDWDGRSGVHTHMTNTRITDPEVLERRYPVVVEQFQLRKGSGGEGKHRGGDGLVRELR
ncbi:5-oxoprolinase, partial [Salpingoeca rosetta]